MNPLLAQFLVEGREQIAATTDGLLALERDTADADLLNGVFRSVHTLKGSSGLFDLPALTATLHAAEDLLVSLRERRLTLVPAMMDQILGALDLVSGWLDAVEDTGRLPDTAAAEAAPAVAALRSWLGGPAGPAATPAAVPAEAAAAAPPAWLATVPEPALLAALLHGLTHGAPLSVLRYRPEPQCFFKGDDPLALVRQVPEALSVGLEEPETWPDLADYDPFSCGIGFRVISAAPRSELLHLLRYVADQAEVVEVEAAELLRFAPPPPDDPLVRDLALEAGALLRLGDLTGVREAALAAAEALEARGCEPGPVRWLARLCDVPGAAGETVASLAAVLVTALATGTAPDPTGIMPAGIMPAAGAGAVPGMPAAAAFSPAVGLLLREQAAMLAQPCDAAERVGRIGSAAKVAAGALRHDGRFEPAGTVAAAGRQALAAADPAPLLSALERVLEPLSGGPAPAPGPAAVAAPALLSAEAEKPRRPDRTGAAGEEGHDRAATVLRVDQARIDAMMNLIGELVVAKNGLPFLARRAEDVFGSRELAREVKEQYAVIDRIALDLRNAIMQVRMLPVSTVFQRFPRLVRDLSRKLGKQVEMVIEGEDTQADKTVIENLFEPLLHLVRNALDHGIEADRTAAGKTATATLTLAARQDNDQVVIRVEDDGRGIDPALMRRKAVEKGLIDADAAARMGDDEAVRLIFAAGFSTAAEVTDVSGRGVGMDAVRTTVEKSGGRIDVSSRVGQGTAISLVLPLSMAVTRVMTVGVSGRQFGIPMDQINETVRIRRADIASIKDREVFVLRNGIIPLVHLDRLLDLPPRHQAEEVAVLVVQVDKQTVGLAIDAFGESMEVIVRPLEGVLADTPDYLGTALLGDGRVLLVLNLKEIVR
ncbi:chemotaxis protein CheA [Rhodocista pekingensis]|uniref:histidine kinase n=1 Tax=Rhodocista pekingensis TaxID=201185 RepID=A0ABW2KZA2_9PROT